MTTPASFSRTVTGRPARASRWAAVRADRTAARDQNCVGCFRHAASSRNWPAPRYSERPAPLQAGGARPASMLRRRPAVQTQAAAGSSNATGERRLEPPDVRQRADREQCRPPGSRARAAHRGRAPGRGNASGTVYWTIVWMPTPPLASAKADRARQGSATAKMSVATKPASAATRRIAEPITRPRQPFRRAAAHREQRPQHRPESRRPRSARRAPWRRARTPRRRSPAAAPSPARPATRDREQQHEYRSDRRVRGGEPDAVGDLARDRGQGFPADRLVPCRFTNMRCSAIRNGT